MTLREKVHKTLLYLQRGDVPPLWQLLPEERRPTDAYLTVVDERADCVSWLDSESEYVRNNADEKRSAQYFLSLSEQSPDQQVAIDPPFPFDGLDFHLLNTASADAVTVRAVGMSAEGDGETVETSYTAGTWCQHNHIPISLRFEESVEQARLTVETKDATPTGRLARVLDHVRSTDNCLEPTISAPTVRRANADRPPVVLISVDTLRYDHLDAFAPVLSELGEAAVVPAEPRTQGTWTRPSHATMLTGVHPGTHGYVVGSGSDWDVPVHRSRRP